MDMKLFLKEHIKYILFLLLSLKTLLSLLSFEEYGKSTWIEAHSFTYIINKKRILLVD